MIISVVNHTHGRVSDEELQRVLRAINRQLAEDFALYWHKDVACRLEGAVPGGPAVGATPELRGDAILYLWESSSTEDPLGYHDLNARGVPYGFVFLDLAEALGEHWSVTLSHEALELAVDPEVNLLVSGPHPEEPQREVFHWYEICDAVQADIYEIDGVEVSNFLLPLYFTGHEESGSRNDFLGARGDVTPVRSFATRPGGYIGFFDPVLGDHTSWTHPDDARARKMLEVREQVGALRRGERHQDSCSGHGEKRQAEDEARRLTPRVEGLALDLQLRPRQSALRVAKALLRDHELEAIWREPEQFDADDADCATVWVQAPDTVGIAQAWESAHRLREDARVRWVEPLFEVPSPGRVHDAGEAVRASSGSGRGHLPASTRPEWSLEQIRAPQAWALPPAAGGATLGAGIRIGHPDTGYTEHPELADRVRRDQGYDFVDGDDQARDPLLSRGVIPNPGHGTATASVAVSPRGPAQAGETAFVSGVAPAAELVPYRVTGTVVLLSTTNLARAIRRAVHDGCHVLSISLGSGWGSRTLRKALDYAGSNGLIVVAAAGNQVRFVVAPARYDETIAVAATNVEERPWRGSSRGSDVDVAAPGESVWNADVVADGGGPLFRGASRGNGTSFSAATVAGVAALWLAFHGRETLLRRYGPDGLAAVFKKVLVEHGVRRPAGWDVNRYGAGIVDAERLLRAPLPEVSPARGMQAVRAAGLPRPHQRLRDFEILFEDLPSDVLRAGLAELLRIDESRLPSVLEVIGDELEFHLLTDDLFRERFAAKLRNRQQGDARRAARGLLADEALADLLPRHAASAQLSSYVLR